jgi:hypothetical protein
MQPLRGPGRRENRRQPGIELRDAALVLDGGRDSR